MHAGGTGLLPGVDTGDRVGKDFSGYAMSGELGPEGEVPGVESGNLDLFELLRGIAACTREDEPRPGELCMKMAGTPVRRRTAVPDRTPTRRRKNDAIQTLGENEECR